MQILREVMSAGASADDQHRLSLYVELVGRAAGMQNRAGELIRPLKTGNVRKTADTGCQNDMTRSHRSHATIGRPQAHGPMPVRAVVFSAQKRGFCPNVELHSLGIERQPVGKFVLRNEDRPSVGERQIGKMIYAYFVVQL